jgi:glycosyltransferase involved in cell wall biosynthesis
MRGLTAPGLPVGRPPRISIVVPARNAADTVEACLASILAADYPPALREIVVVDNASTDGTGARAARFPVTCVTEATRGRAHARNRGIRASQGDVVAFTDADCLATSGWLQELARPFADDRVDAVAGEILAYPPATPAQRYMARRIPRMQASALRARRPYFATGNVAFRRTTFARVGLFDPRFVTGEDQDFAWRFLRAGLAFRYAPGAVVYHRHRAGGWAFFGQQLGWARGAVLLRRHHGLPWGVRDELAEYATLGRRARELTRAVLRWPWGRSGGEALSDPFYGVARELAYRLVGLSFWLPRRRPGAGERR